ncbi:MAG: hypothetical protein AAB438_02010 [Patescibacteria group bacterium]
MGEKIKITQITNKDLLESAEDQKDFDDFMNVVKKEEQLPNLNTPQAREFIDNAKRTLDDSNMSDDELAIELIRRDLKSKMNDNQQ